MEWEALRKHPKDYAGANLEYCEGTISTISWTQVRPQLDGLPGRGLKIVHEAIDNLLTSSSVASSSLFAIRDVAVCLDFLEQLGHARFTCAPLRLCDDIGCSPSRANELGVEGAEVDLLFRLCCCAPIGHTRADLILDDHSEEPALTCMDGRDFQDRDGSDFAQLLAFLIAEVKLPSHRNLARLNRASSAYSEGRWRSVMLRHDPSNDLLSVDIDWKGLHLWYSPRRLAACSLRLAYPVPFAEENAAT